MGFATVTMGYTYRLKVISNIKDTDYYKDAMASLRKHKGAVHLLGEPIKDGLIDIDNAKINFTKTLEAQYEVPVNGSKLKGKMYFHAKRDSETDKWTVDCIRLGLKSDSSRVLNVKSA